MRGQGLLRELGRRAGVWPTPARLELHRGYSATTVAQWRDEERRRGAEPRVQLVFLDADHSVEGVWAEFLAAEPMLETGGYVLLHDTFPEMCGHEGPRHLLDNVNTRAAGKYERMDLYLSPINYGFGLLRRVG